ncbi:MAG: hypothetical protein GX117_03435 [Candidatus Hydrogenedentes bacterium]|jgi:hypothetical protein|nr:hypothetical protein [Candidatus Hydrogenedentota bacterium]
MITDTLKARLNLNAVLRNLEVLPELDTETQAQIKDWDVSIRFWIKGDISPVLRFKEGRCYFEQEAQAASDVILFFMSPLQLNNMFENKGNPIPLKGFTRLGFLKNEFAQLTQRLEYFLKPDQNTPRDDTYKRINTALSLYTAAYAAKELAALDPVASIVAAQTPSGIVQIRILPEGPYAWARYKDKGIVDCGRGEIKDASAVLSFRNHEIANAAFTGELDEFGSVALGDVELRGMLPLIDNTNLILDRIGTYLS